MNILIIGSEGFIGSHLLRYFAQKNDTFCIGADILPTSGTHAYIQLDAADCDFAQIFLKYSVDVCINCSGAASVPDSMKTPLRDFHLNTYNLAKILEAIRAHAPHCKLINLSSAAVYGNPRKLPVKETDELSPMSPYGMHKVFAERLCEEFSRFFGLKCASLRIFSAYGSGLRKQILWDISQKAIQNKDNIMLFGTGDETRDFIHVHDIVRCIELVIQHSSFDGCVYNVANGLEVTIREVAELVTASMGYKGGIIFSGEVRPGDPLNWKADISRIRELGYVTQIPIKQGINNYIKWLQNETLV